MWKVHGWFKLYQWITMEIQFLNVKEQRKDIWKDEVTNCSITNETNSNWCKKHRRIQRINITISKTRKLQEQLLKSQPECNSKKIFLTLRNTSQTFYVNLPEQSFQINHWCNRLSGAIFLNINRNCTTDRVVLMN